MVHELELTLLVNLDIEEYNTFYFLFLLLKLSYNLLTAKYRNIKCAALTFPNVYIQVTIIQLEVYRFLVPQKDLL